MKTCALMVELVDGIAKNVICLHTKNMNRIDINSTSIMVGNQIRVIQKYHSYLAIVHC